MRDRNSRKLPTINKENKVEDEIKLKEKKPVYEKLFLSYQFSAEELQDIAKTLAAKTQQIAEVEDAKKSAVAQFEGQKKALILEQGECARKYSAGHEMRNIECEVVFDYENGVVRHFRTDNGIMGNERKMTQAERQMRFDEVEVDPIDNAEQLSLASAGVLAMNEAMEADEHANGVNRFMSQERSSL
jgi:hypothetical protein